MWYYAKYQAIMPTKNSTKSPKAGLEKILNDHKKALNALKDEQQALLIQEELLDNLSDQKNESET